MRSEVEEPVLSAVEGMRPYAMTAPHSFDYARENQRAPLRMLRYA
jgi:hypothetical protein